MNPELQKAIDDPEFAKILEESESYYEDAASFYNWDPPNGETICQVSDVRADKVADDRMKKDVLRIRVSVEIQQGEFQGKSFDLSGPFGWTPRSFVGLKTLASVLAEEPITKLAEALDVVYDNVGAMVRVSTTRTPRQSGDGVWTNHRVLEKMSLAGEDNVEPEDNHDGVDTYVEPLD